MDVPLWSGRAAAGDTASKLIHAESIQSNVSTPQGTVEDWRHDAFILNGCCCKNKKPGFAERVTNLPCFEVSRCGAGGARGSTGKGGEGGGKHVTG